MEEDVQCHVLGLSLLQDREAVALLALHFRRLSGAPVPSFVKNTSLKEFVKNTISRWKNSFEGF